MILTVVAAVWVAVSIVTAPVLGRTIRGPVRLAPVLALFPPAASSGEEASRRGLPARLSPRATLPALPDWTRLRRELVSHGWLVGLLLAGVLVYALVQLQAIAPVTSIR